MSLGLCIGLTLIPIALGWLYAWLEEYVIKARWGNWWHEPYSITYFLVMAFSATAAIVSWLSLAGALEGGW